jgi:hypothetical protein
LVTLQVALTCPALPDSPELVLLLPGLQAAKVSTAMLPIAAKERVDVRQLRSRLTRESAFHRGCRGETPWTAVILRRTASGGIAAIGGQLFRRRHCTDDG